METRFIFVTGGVCSGLGKGIATASIGALLKASGYSVAILKLDPYINVDPGTMSPLEHGEVFVTDDGYEADLDLGHYERFIDRPLSRLSNITSGQIYSKIIDHERHGKYLGKTIQIIPHVTTAIKERIKELARESNADFVLIEIGGTVGDIEGEPYLEAARQFHREVGSRRAMFVLLTLLPYLETSGELKTKPSQMAVRELHRVGIQPDLILARSDHEVSQEIREKIASFCDVAPECVVPALTAKSIYAVPLNFEQFAVSRLIAKHFDLEVKAPELSAWERLAEGLKNHLDHQITVGMVGKYTTHGDAYISVHEALIAAAAYHGVRLNIIDIDSEKLESDDEAAWEQLKSVGGVLVPGGFGHRGVEGKIITAQYAREERLPYLGLCLGMQIMAIDFARSVLGDTSVNSTEFDQGVAHDVVHILPEQRVMMAEKNFGASMRLGAYPCDIAEGSRAYRAYTANPAHAVPLEQRIGGVRISERHRHRYEFNSTYRQQLADRGMIFSGVNSELNLVEIIELKDHPFMVGVQFHPEFQSRPLKPHPLFRDFIAAIIKT